MTMGAWSIVVALWQQYEYYYYLYLMKGCGTIIKFYCKSIFEITSSFKTEPLKV